VSVSRDSLGNYPAPECGPEGPLGPAPARIARFFGCDDSGRILSTPAQAAAAETAQAWYGAIAAGDFPRLCELYYPNLRKILVEAYNRFSGAAPGDCTEVFADHFGPLRADGSRGRVDAARIQVSQRVAFMRHTERVNGLGLAEQGGRWYVYAPAVDAVGFRAPW